MVQPSNSVVVYKYLILKAVADNNNRHHLSSSQALNKTYLTEA